MTGKDLLESMSYVDEQYIEEAEAGNIKAAARLRYLLPLAACLCLVLLGLHLRPLPPPQQAESGMGALAEPGMAMDVEEQKDYSEHDIPMEPAMGANEDMVPGEVPSIVLTILEWAEDGFLAEVYSLVDTDLIPVGTVVKVEMVPNMVVETLKGDLVYAERRMATETDFPVGSLVRVMFQSYSEEENVLRIESVCREDA